MGFLDALFNPNKNTNKGYNSAIEGMKAAQGQTNPFFSQTLSSATGANSILSDLLGVNGPDRQRAALAQYSTGPAYQANLQAGTQAIDQSAAARGMNRSGATLKALQGYGQDLWNNEYQGYLANLAGLQGGGYNAAQGITGNAANLGQLRIGRGQAQDAGNAASFGNIVGLGTTILGAATGMPSFGKLFGQPKTGGSPFAYQQLQKGVGGLW